MAARRKIDLPPAGVDPRPYPYLKDLTHAGRFCNIPGRRGKFKILARETQPKTGASWWSLIGPQTAGDPGQFTNVREINLLPVSRKAVA